MEITNCLFLFLFIWDLFYNEIFRTICGLQYLWLSKSGSNVGFEQRSFCYLDPHRSLQQLCVIPESHGTWLWFWGDRWVRLWQETGSHSWVWRPQGSVSSCLTAGGGNQEVCQPCPGILGFRQGAGGGWRALRLLSPPQTPGSFTDVFLTFSWG